MIQFKVIRTTDENSFASQMQHALNEGWGISWQGCLPYGEHQYGVYHIAHLSKES